jgi:hypothetical protein
LSRRDRAGDPPSAFGSSREDCLRHSSIVRSLIAGTPTRVVAALHDTSTVQLERVYSAFIADHADTVARRGLIDTSTPTSDVNVVTLPARQ